MAVVRTELARGRERKIGKTLKTFIVLRNTNRFWRKEERKSLQTHRPSLSNVWVNKRLSHNMVEHSFYNHKFYCFNSTGIMTGTVAIVSVINLLLDWFWNSHLHSETCHLKRLPRLKSLVMISSRSFLHHLLIAWEYSADFLQNFL